MALSNAEIGSFTWDFYTFERRGHPADLAKKEDSEKVYFVFMVSTADEHDDLYEQLLLPAVEAMAALDQAAPEKPPTDDIQDLSMATLH